MLTLSPSDVRTFIQTLFIGLRGSRGGQEVGGLREGARLHAQEEPPRLQRIQDELPAGA
jgi:hypothetical protein